MTLHQLIFIIIIMEKLQLTVQAFRGCYKLIFSIIVMKTSATILKNKIFLTFDKFHNDYKLLNLQN